MGFFDWVAVWTNYGGVIIGFALVIVATFLLPAKIRWYVFTAGVGILIFRTWQIYSTGKKFKAWDQKDVELRKTFDGLKKESGVLVGQLNAQRQQLDQIQTKKIKLEQEAKALRGNHSSLVKARQQRNDKVKQLDVQHAVLNQRVEKMLNAHQAVEKAEQLLAKRKKIKETALSDAELLNTFK